MREWGSEEAAKSSSPSVPNSSVFSEKPAAWELALCRLSCLLSPWSCMAPSAFLPHGTLSHCIIIIFLHVNLPSNTELLEGRDHVLGFLCSQHLLCYLIYIVGTLEMFMNEWILKETDGEKKHLENKTS